MTSKRTPTTASGQFNGAAVDGGCALGVDTRALGADAVGPARALLSKPARAARH
jgi:hypothetical protein